ncbi:MAG: hypothetical protein ACIAQF_00555 [Phycisphaerales bacterium JB065]
MVRWPSADGRELRSHRALVSALAAPQRIRIMLDRWTGEQGLTTFAASG